MDRETKHVITICGTVIAVLAITLCATYAYSGVNPPFSVINSGSMQHSQDTSYIGVIDTGDMMLVINPEKKDIITYVEGEKIGYSQFGGYGDVVVYVKPDMNVIHRAMLELEMTQKNLISQVWYIPSLIGYDNWDITKTNGNSLKETCWNEDTGELTVKLTDNSRFHLLNVGYQGSDISMDLYKFGVNQSQGCKGYLTKGDNVNTNTSFDQAVGISDYLITKDDIRSIAAFEIPWIGSIKLLLNGKGDNIPSNSLVSLALSAIGIVTLIVILNIMLAHIEVRKSNKKK